MHHSLLRRHHIEVLLTAGGGTIVRPHLHSGEDLAKRTDHCGDKVWIGSLVNQVQDIDATGRQPARPVARPTSGPG